MSNLKYPETNSRIACERALDMILASISREELALSHIMNTEREKLQYLLDTLEVKGESDAHFDEILAVNQSIRCHLEAVAQNLGHVKGRMDQVLKILPGSDIGAMQPAKGNNQAGKCCNQPMRSAIFKGANKFEIWSSGCALAWDMGNIRGENVQRNESANAQIQIRAGRRYCLSFAVNVRSQTSWQSNIAISLQECAAEGCSDLFIYQNSISCAEAAFTAALSGLMVDTSQNSSDSVLRLVLISPDRLRVEDAMLNIVEI